MYRLEMALRSCQVCCLLASVVTHLGGSVSAASPLPDGDPVCRFRVFVLPDVLIENRGINFDFRLRG